MCEERQETVAATSEYLSRSNQAKEWEKGVNSPILEVGCGDTGR